MSDPMLPPGTSRCKCTLCGRYFGGVGGFDLHQRDGEGGRTVCLDPATLGMVLSGGYWVRPTPGTVAPPEPAAVATGSPERRRGR